MFSDNKDKVVISLTLKSSSSKIWIQLSALRSMSMSASNYIKYGNIDKACLGVADSHYLPHAWSRIFVNITILFLTPLANLMQRLWAPADAIGDPRYGWSLNPHSKQVELSLKSLKVETSPTVDKSLWSKFCVFIGLVSDKERISAGILLMMMLWKLVI